MLKTLKKIESNERISRIMDASNHYSDSNMTRKIIEEHFKERSKSKEPTDDSSFTVLPKSFGMILRKWTFLPNMTQHQWMHLSAIHFILCPIL
jgi:hypothetical protein